MAENNRKIEEAQKKLVGVWNQKLNIIYMCDLFVNFTICIMKLLY